MLSPINAKILTIDQISRHPLWLAALHLDEEPENSGFYLDDNKERTSKSELLATINAFRRSKNFKRAPQNRHPQCIFPYRLHLLRLWGQKFADIDCPELKRWVRELSPRELAIVFAGNHPDNPASIFGHTFFKLTTNHENPKSPFRYYAIDYSARTGTDSGVIFALLGLVGGYEGHFSLEPYFIKLKSYARMESRELWEYPLNLSREDIQRMLLHVWELESTTYYSYYFLDKNCSYRILWLIEGVRPDLDLTSPFYILTPPTQTLRVLKDLKLISEFKFIPSSRQKLEANLEALSDKERKQFKHHIENSAPSEKYADLMIQYIDFKKISRGLNSSESDFFKELLRFRSTINTSVVKKKFLPDVDPLKSHQEYSVSISQAYNQEQSTSFSTRLGIHRWIEPPEGYLDYSNLEAFAPQFTYYYDSQKLLLEKFIIVDIANLNPLKWWEKSISWRARAYYQRQEGIDCYLCQEWVISPGMGFAIGEQWVWSAFAYSEAVWSPSRKDSFRLGPRAELALLGQHKYGAVRISLSSFYEISSEKRWQDHQINIQKSIFLDTNFQIVSEYTWRKLYHVENDYSLSSQFFF